MKRVHLIISGDVVGVGYRSWVRRQAEDLEITGWVKNRQDNTVEIVADGNQGILEEFIKRCRRGPDVSWVEHVSVSWEKATNAFSTFQVLY